MDHDECQLLLDEVNQRLLMGMAELMRLRNVAQRKRTPSSINQERNDSPKSYIEAIRVGEEILTDIWKEYFK